MLIHFLSVHCLQRSNVEHTIDTVKSERLNGSSWMHKLNGLQVAPLHAKHQQISCDVRTKAKDSLVKNSVKNKFKNNKGNSISA